MLAVAATVLSVVTAAGASPPNDAPNPIAVDSLPAVGSIQARDLVIDHRGFGYLQHGDGTLEPYGHSVAAERRPISPRAQGGTPGRPGGGNGVVTFGEWDLGGQVAQSAGRILFEFADGWYVCSGTVVADTTTGRSIVLTAAHCIFDDVAKEFARAAVFIPNQDDGDNDRSDFDCSNDPYGCWILDHGVVDVNWTTRTFPDNVAWDYGYYVVSDSSSHSVTDLASLGDASLESVVGPMTQSFDPPAVGSDAHALGYSYDVDPELMYCKESLSTNGTENYWLSRCDMSGGSSGGPWVQPLTESTGNGPVFSVNSWGYTFQSGMAGPKLHGTSASQLFAFAKVSDLTTSDRGFVVSPGSPPTTTTTTTSEPPTTTTTTTVPGSLSSEATSQGRTWTATVTGPVDLTGTFTGYNGGEQECVSGTCTFTGIVKRVGLVTFTADDPSLGSVEVTKP
jgi:hypothetical protein